MKLEASNITVDLGGRTVVDGASLSLETGKVLALVGPNGAGKSTLLRAIVGVIPKRSGDIRINGGDLSALAPRERAKRLAYLPQDRRVEWRLKARDVVSLGRYPHEQGFGGATPSAAAAISRALADVDMMEFADRPASDLSGGERSRILLARALAVEAPFLLADEPVAALDPYHQLHVMEVLRRRADEGCGAVIVLHDLSLAVRFADALVLMDQGKVIAAGLPSDVLTRERLKAIYRIEAISGAADGAHWILPWRRIGD
jgi:iron complex transport system ATP-binding protein